MLTKPIEVEILCPSELNFIDSCSQNLTKKHDNLLKSTYKH